MKPQLFVLLCSVSFLIHPTDSRAQWANDGNALCTATGTQTDPASVSDGSGGAIVVWADNRNGNYDIFAQRVNAFGAVQWTAGGAPVRVATNNQTSPAIVSDGAGGAIIFYEHLANNGSTDIYAQHMTAAGSQDWLTGVAICTAQFDQSFPRAVADGAGGAIVTWQDNRQGGTIVADVYAQRVNASGVVQWTSDGVAMCTAANKQVLPRIVGDGSGGAVVAWTDFRDNATYGVYARHVTAAGSADWTADGVAVAADIGGENPVAIDSDGAGGAIVAWQNGASDYNINVQRIGAGGTVQWNVGGIPVCAAIYSQTQPEVVADGMGGAIVAWSDLRSTVNFADEDLYAQRVNASGVPQWTLNGVAVCAASGASVMLKMVSDGAHGAVVCWADTRLNDYNVYARRINGAGTPLWTTDGVFLCLASAGQVTPTIAPDGFGGAIVAWRDHRNSPGTPDIYANRVTPGGSVSTPVGDSPAPSFAATAYPNPFSTTTAIDITLDQEADVDIEVFDVAGRHVRAMNAGRVAVGSKSIPFDGRDERGALLPSGIYFCRIQAGAATVTRKIVIRR